MWNKKGVIFTNNIKFWWSHQYAGIPTVELINEETIRVYYYSMDNKMDGRISYIDVNSQNPNEILYVHPEPIIDIGEPGTFDDCGVCPSFLLKKDNKRYLYYLGVQRSEKTPYLYFAGLAIQENNGNFNKIMKTPILDRTPKEPYTRSAVSILKINETYRMWYVSAFEWFSWNDRLYPKYVLRTAISDDAINWKTEDCIVIEFANKYEFGFGRPWVIFEDNIYKLYYSIRSTNEPYKLGYAESKDALNWIRKDNDLNLKASTSGWDSEMICYPSIINTKYGKYMFYNGNSHGASGFGYAKWEK